MLLSRLSSVRADRSAGILPALRSSLSGHGPRHDHARQEFLQGAFAPEGYTPLAGCGKSRYESKKHTSGAEARTNLNDLTARLKSCPSQNPRESEFFRSLLGRIFGGDNYREMVD